MLTVVWNETGLSKLEVNVVATAFFILGGLLLLAIWLTAVAASEPGANPLVSNELEPIPTLILWGSLSGETNTARTAFERLKFQVTNPYAQGAGLDLSDDRTVITYLDEMQQVNFTPEDWSVDWVKGEGELVDPGERVEITLGLSRLTNPLGPLTKFSIQLKPPFGAPLVIRKTAPANLSSVMDIP